MSVDLDDVVSKLHAQFEAAIKRQPRYEDSDYSGSSTPTSFAIDNRQAIGRLGAALIEGLKEQRARAEAGGVFKLDRKA